jgi:hypothetical protein
MARGSLTEYDLADWGGAPSADISYTAGTNGDNYQIDSNNGRKVLLVKNGSAGAVQITVQAIQCSHGRDNDTVYSVDAGAEAMIGPFPASLFNQSDGTVQVDSDTTDASLELAAVVLPRKTFLGSTGPIR